MTFEELDKASREWDSRKRYAIRGKKGTKYENMTAGVTISEDSKERQGRYAILYEDKDYAERCRIENMTTNVAALFEVREITEEELKTIYFKAYIIR